MKKTIALVIIAATASFAAAGPGWEDNSPADPGRSMEEIRENLGEVKNAVQRAYEVLLADQPELSGDIEVSFSIRPNGDLTGAEVICSEGLEEMEEPVLEALDAMEFQPCSGQTDDLPVTVPFTLCPSDDR